MEAILWQNITTGGTNSPSGNPTDINNFVTRYGWVYHGNYLNEDHWIENTFDAPIEIRALFIIVGDNSNAQPRNNNYFYLFSLNQGAHKYWRFYRPACNSTSQGDSNYRFQFSDNDLDWMDTGIEFSGFSGLKIMTFGNPI